MVSPTVAISFSYDFAGCSISTVAQTMKRGSETGCIAGKHRWTVRSHLLNIHLPQTPDSDANDINVIVVETERRLRALRLWAVLPILAMGCGGGCKWSLALVSLRRASHEQGIPTLSAPHLGRCFKRWSYLRSMSSPHRGTSIG